MPDIVSERSGELFDSGFYCAESVLLAISESNGIQSDLIPKIASGFCNGISRTCGMCGAVSGAIMGISLICGRNTPEESVENNYAFVQELLNEFKNKFGSVNCKELIGCDLNTEEGQEFFESNKLIEKCRQYTIGATEIAQSLVY